MKLQHATRYAIWSIVELASRPGEQVSANELAALYGISQHHLAKVLRTLARARMVASVRGPGGGCTFIGNANRLTLYDIIKLFEDDWPSDEGPPAARSDSPVAREVARVIGEIDRITSATLRSVTVRTIISNARRAAPPATGRRLDGLRLDGLEELHSGKTLPPALRPGPLQDPKGGKIEH